MHGSQWDIDFTFRPLPKQNSGFTPLQHWTAIICMYGLLWGQHESDDQLGPKGFAHNYAQVPKFQSVPKCFRYYTPVNLLP